MGFLKSLIDRYKRKKWERNEACNTLIRKIDITIADADNLFMDKMNFIEPQWVERWSGQYRTLFDEILQQL